MTVTIAREAEADLEAIADFIAADNAARAVSFVLELVDACHRLVEYPLRHPVRLDYQRPVRRFVYKGYSIYYEIRSQNHVVVVHILSDALDHQRYFKPS